RPSPRAAPARPRGAPAPSPGGQSPTGPTPQLASLGRALRARSSSGHSPKLASRPTILRAGSVRPSVSERGVEPDGLCPAGGEGRDAPRCSKPSIEPGALQDGIHVGLDLELELQLVTRPDGPRHLDAHLVPFRGLYLDGSL